MYVSLGSLNVVVRLPGIYSWLVYLFFIGERVHPACACAISWVLKHVVCLVIPCIDIASFDHSMLQLCRMFGDTISCCLGLHLLYACMLMLFSCAIDIWYNSCVLRVLFCLCVFVWFCLVWRVPIRDLPFDVLDTVV